MSFVTISSKCTLTDGVSAILNRNLLTTCATVSKAAPAFAQETRTLLSERIWIDPSRGIEKSVRVSESSRNDFETDAMTRDMEIIAEILSYGSPAEITRMLLDAQKEIPLTIRREKSFILEVPEEGPPGIPNYPEPKNLVTAVKTKNNKTKRSRRDTPDPEWSIRDNVIELKKIFRSSVALDRLYGSLIPNYWTPLIVSFTESFAENFADKMDVAESGKYWNARERASYLKGAISSLKHLNDIITNAFSPPRGIPAMVTAHRKNFTISTACHVKTIDSFEGYKKEDITTVLNWGETEMS